MGEVASSILADSKFLFFLVSLLFLSIYLSIDLHFSSFPFFSPHLVLLFIMWSFLLSSIICACVVRCGSSVPPPTCIIRFTIGRRGGQESAINSHIRKDDLERLNLLHGLSNIIGNGYWEFPSSSVSDLSAADGLEDGYT